MMKKYEWEHSLLRALARFCADGTAIYPPYEEPLASAGKLQNAEAWRPILFKEMRSQVMRPECLWIKKDNELSIAQEQKFWEAIKSLEKLLEFKCPSFPIEPDQEEVDALMPLMNLKASAKFLPITLIAYSMIDYDLEKIFSAVRARADRELLRGESVKQSIHNVEAWLKQLAIMETLGVFGNLVRPGPPYWKITFESLLDSVKYHEELLEKFRKGIWPNSQIHLAFGAGKKSKDKPYRSWAISGLVALLEHAGVKSSKDIVKRLYSYLGLDLTIKSYVNRQSEKCWILPDPSTIWDELSAILLVINLSPDLAKSNRDTVAVQKPNGKRASPKSPK